MRAVPLLRRESRWVCPNCTITAITHESRPHSQMHECAGLKGLTAPLVPEGMDCKIEAHERDDYIGTDLVRTDGEGTPIMSVVTTRADGTDVVAFAPTATAKAP